MSMLNRQKLIEELERYSIDIEIDTSMTKAEIIKTAVEGCHAYVMQIIESQPPADQWNVISSDEDGVLWNLPEEEVEVLVSYRNRVWVDTLLSDKDGVYFDNYCDCREGMAWKNVEPYKGE